MAILWHSYDIVRVLFFAIIKEKEVYNELNNVINGKSYNFSNAIF